MTSRLPNKEYSEFRTGYGQIIRAYETWLVVGASIIAVGTMQFLFPQQSFHVGFAGTLTASDHAVVFVIKILGAFVAIAMMRTVTLV